MALIIADDHERERAWLKDLMASNFPELLPIYKGNNGQKAVELAAAQKPRLAFLDT